jgi:hypothetical protein
MCASAAPMFASSLDTLIDDHAHRSSQRLPMVSPTTSTQRSAEINVHAAAIGHAERGRLPL